MWKNQVYDFQSTKVLEGGIYGDQMILPHHRELLDPRKNS